MKPRRSLVYHESLIRRSNNKLTTSSCPNIHENSNLSIAKNESDVRVHILFILFALSLFLELVFWYRRSVSSFWWTALYTYIIINRYFICMVYDTIFLFSWPYDYYWIRWRKRSFSFVNYWNCKYNRHGILNSYLFLIHCTNSNICRLV